TKVITVFRCYPKDCLVFTKVISYPIINVFYFSSHRRTGCNFKSGRYAFYGFRECAFVSHVRVSYVSHYKENKSELVNVSLHKKLKLRKNRNTKAAFFEKPTFFLKKMLGSCFFFF